MRKTFLILCLAFSSISTPSSPRTRYETIVGRIDAYSTNLTCLNGNGYWSMVIRAQQPKDSQAEFIRVDFSLLCDRSPEWFKAMSSLQKFRLFRKKDRDEVLVESLNVVDEAGKIDSILPMWKYLSGAEHDKLPFGHVVPSYTSVDLPLAPVI